VVPKSTALLLVSALLLPGAGAAETIVYQVDRAHSSAGFRVRHFVTKVPGQFRELTGTIEYDRQNPAASRVELTVSAASIDTGNEERDTHLRSPDFFDASSFPYLTFASTVVRAMDADTLEVTGELTIRGVPRRITIPVELLGTFPTPSGEKAGSETRFTVNRLDYGITWNRMLDAGTILGDEVEIHIAVEADRQPVVQTP
jgi:polyisoprenoid-binding protein YceI